MSCAIASTSRRVLTGVSRQRAASHRFVVPRVASADLPSISPYGDVTSSKYAILDLGGVRQVVEEGGAYTCTKHLLNQASPGRTFTFYNVMAVREGGKFSWGKPYVTDAAVEAEVLEEFSGPTASMSLDALDSPVPQPTVMAKYKITKIRYSGQS